MVTGHRYQPIIDDTEEYGYSEGLDRLVQLSPDILEEFRFRIDLSDPTMLILDT